MSILRSLRKQLRSLRVKTADAKYIVLEGSLDAILDEATIKRALEDIFRESADSPYHEQFYKRDELTEVIVKGGRKLFATLLLLELEQSIHSFVEKDQLQTAGLDARLPLKIETLNDIFGTLELGKSQFDDAREFFNKQWEFVAPVLREDRSHRILESDTIMPFIVTEKMAAGGFGDVWRITLPSCHQQLVRPDDNGKAVVIRKDIRREVTPGSSRDEERILSSLRYLKHPNIINLLASYTHNEVHSLIFPEADGDLDALLRGKIKRPSSLSLDQDFLRELQGLSSAIASVHDFFVEDFGLRMIGCHYDLKPKNILVRDGKLLLADFGLSRLATVEQGSQDSLAKLQGFYVAPECISSEANFEKFKVGRASDIWSFGCILAEVATYLLRGSEDIVTFQQSRRSRVIVPLYGNQYTTSQFHAHGKANHAVEEWLLMLECEGLATPTRGLVGLIRDILVIEPSARPDAETVTGVLCFLAQKTIFEATCHRFQETLQIFKAHEPSAPLSEGHKSERIELEMENCRYILWGQAVGFFHRRIIDEVAVEEKFKDCEHILLEIWHEMSYLQSWKANSLVPSYYQLRRLVDGLWIYVRKEDRNQMTLRVESMMLDERTSEELLMTKHTFQSHPSPAYRDIGGLAEVKLLTQTVDTAADGVKDELMLQFSDIDISSAVKIGVHKAGILQTLDGCKAVLIESIEYNSGWGGDASLVLRNRVRSKSLLLARTGKPRPADLRVLPCLGYYEDENGRTTSFGLVYHIPALDPAPLTLRNVIDGYRERDVRPPLGDVFELALNFVRSVLEFHKVGWVHKGISVHNVVFFPESLSEQSSPPQPSIRSPFLVGFNHSRQDDPERLTEGLQGFSTLDEYQNFQHPEYVRKGHGFCLEYDYYRVGLVLLEVGHWWALDEMAEDLKMLPPEEIQKRLIEQFVPDLGSYMGEIYREAVHVCLSMESPGRDSGARNIFEDKVVNRIAQCYA